MSYTSFHESLLIVYASRVHPSNCVMATVSFIGRGLLFYLTAFTKVEKV